MRPRLSFVLMTSAAVLAQPAASFRPAVLRDGAPLADVRAGLGAACQDARVHRIDPPFIVLRSHVKDRQLQLECETFAFESKPRRAELIFADDSLEMAWILTDAADELTLLRRMTEAYGPPDKRNSKFVAFTRARAALRLDVPEVLFYSRKVAAQIEGWFATPSTFR